MWRHYRFLTPSPSLARVIGQYAVQPGAPEFRLLHRNLLFPQLMQLGGHEESNCVMSGKPSDKCR
jgi:hypothetical protein